MNPEPIPDTPKRGRGRPKGSKDTKPRKAHRPKEQRGTTLTARPRSRMISWRIPVATLRALEREAEARHCGVNTLVKVILRNSLFPPSLRVPAPEAPKVTGDP